MIKRTLLTLTLPLVFFAQEQDYTLVFSNVKNEENAQTFINKYLKDKKAINILKYKDRYRVTYGEYKSREEANYFYRNLPKKLRKLKPFPVKFDSDFGKRQALAANEMLSLKEDYEIQTKSLKDFEVKPEKKKPIPKKILQEDNSLKMYSLEQIVNEVLLTDPEIKEWLFKYNSVVEEKNLSKSGYYPSVDLVGKIGKTRNRVEKSKWDNYTTSEITLKLIQNLFNGFGTQAAVNRDDARAKAAFNKYIEVAADKIYRALEAYIKVLRYEEVLKIAKENVKIHEETLVKIQNRQEEGFSTLSELERVKGRLALAKSNFISETNNLYDAKFNFHRALGRYVNSSQLTVPEFKYELPSSLQKAQKIAISANPSIMVANYDIEAIRESLKYAKKDFYPTLDLELKASRYHNKSNGFSGDEDDLSALLVLKYNLFNGWADEADKQKYISLLNYEYAHKNKLKRDTVEALSLAWSAYVLIQEQYKHQIDYMNLTIKTKNAYSEEFQLGRRTLIDLLDVQDEVNNIRIKVIHNKYDFLFSKYRILDAMGKLYEAFGHSFEENYKENKMPESLDFDGDKIEDSSDVCDNSILGSIDIVGCNYNEKIEVEKIEFNSKIKEDKEQLNVDDVKQLWNVE